MLIIGLAGGSGSGKTTLALDLKSRSDVEVSVLHLDSYYLPTLPTKLKSSSGSLNFDHPHAFDWELIRTHLHELTVGRSIQLPDYDFATSSRLQTSTAVTPTRVIIIEGIYALFDSIVRDLCHIKCFIDVDADIRLGRRMSRDVEERGRTIESVIGQYNATVKPMYRQFVDSQRWHADIIVGENTGVASDLLRSKMNDSQLETSHFEEQSWTH